jgi:hypothetical protein
LFLSVLALTFSLLRSLFGALPLDHLAALGGGGLCGSLIGPNTMVQYGERMGHIETGPSFQVHSTSPSLFNNWSKIFFLIYCRLVKQAVMADE